MLTVKTTGIEQALAEADEILARLEAGPVSELEWFGRTATEQMIQTHTFQNHTYRLENSIGYRVYPILSHIFRVAVEATAPYACILGGKTKVVTDQGSRELNSIRPGDRVLTQAGDFQAVQAVRRFPAREKPDLIDITVLWRQGGVHTLTLTTDHRVLVEREGLSHWIPAGQLSLADRMFVRKKLAHNVGTGTYWACQHCRKQVYGPTTNNGKFCSMQCRDAAWKLNNPHTGQKRGPETLRLLSERALARRAGLAINRTLAQRGFVARHEAKVQGWLTRRGVRFERQHPVGPYVVDFFLPDEKLIIEADGSYWHQDQQVDIARDQELLCYCPDAFILHVHFKDKMSPSITPIVPHPNPHPRVAYVMCNPSPDSLADPRFFESREILSLRPWTYKDISGGVRYLYDIEVENVHSFIANGLIVSNSQVEEGHPGPPPARPYPFFYPIFWTYEPQLQQRVQDWLDRTLSPRAALLAA